MDWSQQTFCVHKRSQKVNRDSSGEVTCKTLLLMLGSDVLTGLRSTHLGLYQSSPTVSSYQEHFFTLLRWTAYRQLLALAVKFTPPSTGFSFIDWLGSFQGYIFVCVLRIAQYEQFELGSVFWGFCLHCFWMERWVRPAHIPELLKTWANVQESWTLDENLTTNDAKSWT